MSRFLNKSTLNFDYFLPKETPSKSLILIFNLWENQVNFDYFLQKETPSKSLIWDTFEKSNFDLQVTNLYFDYFLPTETPSKSLIFIFKLWENQINFDYFLQKETPSKSLILIVDFTPRFLKGFGLNRKLSLWRFYPVLS